MSQERIEAAAVTLCEQLWENAHESQKEYALEEAAEALAAADAVMFSDEAIERAARVLEPTAWNPRESWFRGHGESIDEAKERFQQSAIARARAVVAALKGDQ